MDEFFDLYPVMDAPSGPPPSPRTKARNTLESLPRGITDCPSYVMSRIYNAKPIHTVDSIADFQQAYDLADEIIEPLLILAPPGEDERLFRGRSSTRDPHFFYVFPLFSVYWGSVSPFPSLFVMC